MAEDGRQPHPGKISTSMAAIRDALTDAQRFEAGKLQVRERIETWIATERAAGRTSVDFVLLEKYAGIWTR